MKRRITSPNPESRVFIPCSKCSKLGRKKTCSQQACLKCCTDDQCEGHREQREKERERELIMEGKHPIQIQARQRLASKVRPGLFRETAFRYLGETLLIWDIRQYCQNSKWRDDAIRKSRRYVESQLYTQVYPPNMKRKQFDVEKPFQEGRRKRFKRVMNHLYQQSLK